MSLYGPFYPDKLQQAVNHAERMAQLLSVGKLAAELDDEWAGAWLVGRDGEIERVVELVVASWRSTQNVDAAASTLVAYLDVLHGGLAARFGIRTPPCCLLELAETKPGRPLEAVASTVVRHTSSDANLLLDAPSPDRTRERSGSPRP